MHSLRWTGQPEAPMLHRRKDGQEGDLPSVFHGDKGVPYGFGHLHI